MVAVKEQHLPQAGTKYESGRVCAISRLSRSTTGYE